MTVDMLICVISLAKKEEQGILQKNDKYLLKY